ncbi:MAG: hypothetical protein A4E36_00215 [Methanoregulaceae archaeon PtaB.Bin009]|nr:MAG: hypothetical protein A4E36_00215 [Methanoregulaceae archaeon PtaB.Bin009]OPY40868.1 MAG: hypothetical protein A4E41_01161 [Methanoregulaceae archaeon PtaU1.Bin066]
MKSGCLVCGRDLVYLDAPEESVCSFCGKGYVTEVRCVEGHYICDDCHRLPAEYLIETTCLGTNIVDPILLAISLMRHPALKMHGPEHHFLVPAVLLTSYSLVTGEREALGGRLKRARERAAMVRGGSCGTHGACGAAIGTGIFVSIMTGATPLSGREWRLSNLMTARSLHEIALAGGPRCCKRNTYIAILAAVSFVKEEWGITIPVRRKIACEFSDLNRECRVVECPFYPGGDGEHQDA